MGQYGPVAVYSFVAATSSSLSISYTLCLFNIAMMYDELPLFTC